MSVITHLSFFSIIQTEFNINTQIKLGLNKLYTSFLYRNALPQQQIILITDDNIKITNLSSPSRFSIIDLNQLSPLLKTSTFKVKTRCKATMENSERLYLDENAKISHLSKTFSCFVDSEFPQLSTIVATIACSSLEKKKKIKIK